MKVLHNSQLTVYREPFGAALCGSSVRLALDVWDEETAEAGEWLTKAQLRLWRDGVGEELLEMQPLPLPDGRRRFAAKVNLPEEGGLVWYYFLLHLANGQLLFYGNNAAGLGGEGCLQTNQPPSFQITVYRPQPLERQPLLQRQLWNSPCWPPP